MKHFITLLASVWAFQPILSANPADRWISSEPQIEFFGISAPPAPDTTHSPVALWLERGTAAITPGAPPDIAQALLLPSRIPTTQVCLLLGGTSAVPANLRFRLQLFRTVAQPGNEILEWNLAGIPVRVIGGLDDAVRVEYHTDSQGWRPLTGSDDEFAGTVWHSLKLEYSPESRGRRLTLDSHPPGAWIDEAGSNSSLLFITGGSETTVRIDDINNSETVLPPTTSAVDDQEAIVQNRNAT